MIYQNAELYNVDELIASGQSAGKLPVRIPEALRQKLNDGAQNAAVQSAGCELRFNLTGQAAEIILAANVPNSWGIDRPVAEIYQGCFQTGWQALGPEGTTIRVLRPAYQEQLINLSSEHQLPFDAALTRVILPYRPPVRLVDFQGEVAAPRKEQVPAVKYLAYGSSITHGHVSVRPTGSWAMQTARELEADLINLGFGGGAHLEPEMADYLAERQDWHFATLEMGINMLSTYSADQFAERVDYFIERIALAHPNKWIFCIDMFLFLRRDLLEREKEMQFRAIVRKKVDALDMPRLVHVPGTDLLGHPDGLTADLVHPSPAGMTAISNNLTRRFRECEVV